jgi:hypothetical protein
VIRKRSALLVAVIVVALLAIGCASEGGTSVPNAGPLPAPQPPPTANAMPTPSSTGTATAAPFTVNANTPKFFADLIALKTPLVVVFYASSDTAWADVSKEVDAVQKVYGSQAEFLKLSLDDSYNMSSLDTSRQVKARQITNLAQQMGVKFTPYLAVIDRNGDLTFTHSGYIDSKTLEQELFKALKR